MAWAEKLPSGRYRAVYRDAAGRRRSAGTHTHKAAAARAANAAEATARETSWRDLDAPRQTWGRWADEVWWPSRTVAASTARMDRLRRANHLDPQWGDVPLGAITRTDVKSWASSLRRAGLSAESVKRCVHLLSASLAAAVDAEVIEANPAARLRLPSGPTDRERYLTREQVAAIREQLPTELDRFVLDLLVSTGIRWGELAGLHRARVDTARALLRVVETWDETSSRMKADPKGKRSRAVPLTPELVERIDSLEPVGESCGCEHEVGRCVGPLLVTTPSGAPLRNQNWANRVWRPAVARSGVGHVRPHDLRHTYASWLLQAGVPLAEVGRLLGHRSPVTTARYAHLAEVPSEAVLAALRGPSAPRLPHEEVDVVRLA